MIPVVLVSVSLFAARAYSIGSEYANDVKQIMSQIEHNFKIDLDHTPYFESPRRWEPTCVENWGKCPRIGKFERYLLSSGKPTVKYTVNEDANMDNFNPATSVLTATNSTAIIQSRTVGWTIGAKLSAEGKGVGAEVSASYSDSSTNGGTYTKTVSYQETCLPGYRCRIETWTFYIDYTGLCVKQLILDCDSKYTIAQCVEPVLGCQQFIDYHNLCDTGNLAPCDVKVPLYRPSGEPYTRVVLASDPPVGKRARRSELDSPQTEYRIIG
ncbi:hypothetical protein V500_00664 [Pseudogymnoascus sp. VKM F-4518 (FW-2643)]|nr:hypothetical protein V500_00664 [Pseudogymnoascus sp. VKM F-4518 (FW-2643)]